MAEPRADSPQGPRAPPGDFSHLEALAGHRFRKPELLREALTHKSHASETKKGRFNERLEFLGDAVLSTLVAAYLYEHLPDADEGRLSKQKSQLVSRPALNRWARELDLGSFIFLGAGEEGSGGRHRTSIVANALEALIGALYLDGGFEAAKGFILPWVTGQHPKVTETDYKSRLQEIFQKRYKTPPDYELKSAVGPDHDKTFSVSVRLGDRLLGAGTGKSKKEAEQSAAQDALRRLGA